MQTASIPQHPPPQADKSTTMWTQPQTEAQRTYFSKHAPKRRAYGIIMTLLQIAHGAVAFAAWAQVFSWAFQRFQGFQFIVVPLAIASLLALHWLFRVTWDTFWYDRLDDDPQTDSSPWIPIGILIVLLGIEIKGASMFLTNQVEAPKVASTAPIDSTHTTTITSFEQAYRNQKAEIASVYDAKEKAATARFDRQIRSLQNRVYDNVQQRTEGHRQVASLRAQRDAALAPIQAARAEALDKALATFTQRRDAESNRRDQAVAGVDETNQRETNRYTSEIDSVASYAWMLSIGLLGLIAALGYARVRINVKSGILPLRNYTVLDAHGSMVERLGTALSDAFNRRGLQLAVWIHRLLSPNGKIISFDGTVVSEAGKYNTIPSPPNNGAPAPAPPAEPFDAATFHKVIQKMQQSGTRLTPSEFADELARARQLNGHYVDAPLPGKP